MVLHYKHNNTEIVNSFQKKIWASTPVNGEKADGGSAGATITGGLIGAGASVVLPVTEAPPVTPYLDCVSSKFEAKTPGNPEKASYIAALKFLNKRNPFIADKIYSCRTGEIFARLECQGCHKTVDAPVLACNDALCPECRKYYAKRKATEATERIKPFSAGRFKGKIWGFPYAEFTVPDKWWHLFLDRKNLSKFYRVVRQTLEQWYNLDEIGFVQCCHTNSSKKYWKFKPHVPVQLAGIGYSKTKGWLPLRLKREPWELRHLRSIYTVRMLAAFPETQPEDVKTKDGLLDVNYGFVKTVAELGERLQYTFRYPSPGRRRQGWVAMENLSNIEVQGVAAQFMLLKGFRRIRWCGFLATRKGQWLKAELGVETKPWKVEVDYRQCPYCGGYLKFMGFMNDEVRAPPEHEICPN